MTVRMFLFYVFLPVLIGVITAVMWAFTLGMGWLLAGTLTGVAAFVVILVFLYHSFKVGGV